MVKKLFSAELAGISASLVEVEVDLSRGQIAFNIVGLPDTAVKESKDRIRTAIKNSSFTFPGERLTVNLAPADLKKESSKLDVPIAVGIIGESSNLLNGINLKNKIFAGELSLDGKVRSVTGILSIANLAKKLKKELFVPYKNYCEAVAVEGLKITPFKSLNNLLAILKGYEEPEYPQCKSNVEKTDYLVNLEDVKGQNNAKRALIIAAAGGHNMLMYGPPGSGKTMLARCIPSILPEMDNSEQIMTTMIYSAGGVLGKDRIIKTRPFRAPHHTISHVGLIGGGSKLNPGEVSYAHNGILFLDEFPEFSRRTLEVLRQPLEDGVVRIARASGSVEFPSRFNLIAAMNPCPCGYYGSKEKECSCTPTKINNYRSRLSGPLLDRIDILVNVPQIPINEMRKEENGMKSVDIRKIIEETVEIQKGRANVLNAYLNERQMKKFCNLDDQGEKLLITASRKMKLSSRTYNRVLKISRTLADLEKKENISSCHIAEALTYKLSDFFGGIYTYDWGDFFFI